MKYRIATVIIALLVCACDTDRGAPRPTSQSSNTVTADTSPTVDSGGAKPLPGPAEELLYSRPDQSLWLYGTDTGTQTQIVPGGACPTWYSARWSPEGSMFAVNCGPGADQTTFIFGKTGNELDRLRGAAALEWSGDTLLLVRQSVEMVSQSAETQGVDRASFVVYRGELSGGDRAREIPDVATGLLSPDGSMLAYYRSADAPCVPDCATGLTMLSIGGGNEQALGDLVPRMWTSDSSSLIVVSDLQPGCTMADPRLLDVETGGLTAIPVLHRVSQTEPTVSGNSLVALACGSSMMLSVVDLSTGLTSLVEGSFISFPSDHIPPNNITSTVDHIYWFDGGGEAGAWYRADYDGAGLEKLGEADALSLQFSPSVSYVGYSTTGTAADTQRVIVSTIDGSAEMDIGAGRTMAWRPARE